MVEPVWRLPGGVTVTHARAGSFCLICSDKVLGRRSVWRVAPDDVTEYGICVLHGGRRPATAAIACMRALKDHWAFYGVHDKVLACEAVLAELETAL